MYRDGFDAAAAELEKSVKRLEAREEKLDERTRGKLPAGVLEELARLKRGLTPTETTVEAVRACEETLSAYEHKLTDALNLAAQIRGAEERGENVELTAQGVPLMVSRVRRWLGRAAVLGALYGAFAWLPGWLLQTAHERSSVCLATLPERPEARAEDCRERALLLWPLAVPWTHMDALAEWRGTAADVARLAGARDLHGAETRASSLRDDANAYALARQGAWEALAASDLVAVQALAAAATLADLDAVRRHAWRQDPDPMSASDDLVRGSWLCLLGEREAGLTALMRSDALFRRTIDTRGVGGTKQRLALAACRGTSAELGFSPYHLESYGQPAMTLLRLADPSWEKGRRLAVLRELRDGLDGEPHALAAHALASSGELLSVGDALAWVADSGVLGRLRAPADVLSPWALLTPADVHDDGRVAPSVYRAAARLSARLAAKAPERGEVPTRAGYGHPAVDEAYLRPRETLLEATWLFYWHAAVGYARWGKWDQALAAVGEASRAAPTTEHWRFASIHVAARDHEGALAKLATVADVASLEDADHYYFRLNRAYALAGLARFVEARAEARWVALSEGVAAVGEGAEALLLEVVTALLANEAVTRVDAAIPLGMPSSFDTTVHEGWVWALRGMIDQPAEERAKLRVRLPSPVFARFHGAPAAFVLAGRMVEDPADHVSVERWLDRAFAHWHGRGSGRAALAHARAEAARWRGDEVSAAKWQERADKLFALIDSHEAAILTDMTGEL